MGTIELTYAEIDCLLSHLPIHSDLSVKLATAEKAVFPKIRLVGFSKMVQCTRMEAHILLRIAQEHGYSDAVKEIQRSMKLNNKWISTAILGEEVIATALRFMCDHAGVDNHTIQLVVHLDTDKFYGSEFRCAVCINRSPFLLVNSATQAVELRNFLMAKGVKVTTEVKQSGREA
jgi:hypothetical protein